MPTSIPDVDPGPTSPPAKPIPAPRLASLDQFRGYTVVGMFLVNYLSGFAVTPAVLGHHNTYCSYADTIMPQFFFAVGFAFRLTFGRRAATAGLGSAYRRVARRFLGLALVAIAFYTYLDGSGLWAGFTGEHPWATLYEAAKRTWCQTLMHIALTSLWVLPVIRASASVRIAYMIFSACVHIGLSYQFNLTWINTPPGAIDGGPLGFLTWCIPTLVGSLACDAVMGAADSKLKLVRLAIWSGVIMLVGYAFSCGTRLYDNSRTSSPTPDKPLNMVLPRANQLGDGGFSSYLAEPPFVPPPGKDVRQENYWMMSQRYSTVSYQVFSAGFSLAVYVLFLLFCDRWGLQLGLFRTLGRNALLGYILGGLIQRQIKRSLRAHFGNNASAWQVAGGFLLLVLCVYLILRLLEWRKIYVRM